MADGELYNWMRSMQACHEKHIGGPPALHRRIAYAATYAEPEYEGGFARLLRRVASLLGRLRRRRGRGEAP